MYAGITIRKGSGRIVGVHQKIDRIARRQLKRLVPGSVYFPSSKEIIHFEGLNGPDGIKRKSPSIDEPWHFIDPTKSEDRSLIGDVNDHLHNLTEALRSKNEVRSAFEASWLAHAIIDGLTPAHHFPMSAKIEELWGKPYHERSSVREKNIIKGLNLRDTLSKNWQYWGTKGVITTHFNFEIGVASVIYSDRFNGFKINKVDLDNLRQLGFEKMYIESVQKIDALKMYDELNKTGWTVSLAQTTKLVLIPEMIKMVALAWYKALILSRDKA